jgi:hypothetical protein
MFSLLRLDLAGDPIVKVLLAIPDMPAELEVRRAGASAAVVRQRLLGNLGEFGDLGGGEQFHDNPTEWHS